MKTTKILNFAFIISCVILSGCRRETDTPKAQYDKCQEMLETGREELASQNLDEYIIRGLVPEPSHRLPS